MSQSKSVVVVALSVFLLSAGLGAFQDQQQPTRVGGLSGVQEFLASGTFTVPPNVTHVMLTMWGAGGGASAGFEVGAGGGGGAYTNTVARVIPGATCNVTVGLGGIGGGNPGNGANGTDGGDSQFALGNTVLAFAGGGGGGRLGIGSAGLGSGGRADSTAQISHPGNVPNVGNAYASNLIPQGNNFQTAIGGVQGGNGGQGYVLLTF